MDEEEWMTIQDFPDYRVSSHGRIKSLRKSFELIMKLIKNGNGYQVVYLYNKPGIDTKCYVHRLVAQAFLSNSEEKKLVNHKDCKRTNNHLSNLEWATDHENNHPDNKNKNKEDEIPF